MMMIIMMYRMRHKTFAKGYDVMNVVEQVECSYLTALIQKPLKLQP
jgi:hypothetical protein